MIALTPSAVALLAFLADVTDEPTPTSGSADYRALREAGLMMPDDGSDRWPGLSVAGIAEAAERWPVDVAATLADATASTGALRRALHQATVGLKAKLEKERADARALLKGEHEPGDRLQILGHDSGVLFALRLIGQVAS